MPSVSPSTSEFFFVGCQVGAEAAVKAELARVRPEWRSSFSRPGFITFKAAGVLAPPRPERLIFARSFCRSLDGVQADSAAELAAAAAARFARRPGDCLHVWERDAARPGVGGFEPQVTPAAQAALQAIRNAWPEAPPARPALSGEQVLDCVVVDPGRWWLGEHVAGDARTLWPGGLAEVETPAELASRAGRKMEQALRMTGLPIKAGDRIAELGCAPGGAVQVLLARGLHVLGVDPAPPNESVLAHPRFTMMQKRAHEVRKRDFRNVKWLASDVNAPPNYVLDAVEAIVRHPANRIRGLLLTVKMRDWSLAEQAHDYVQRVRDWGFSRTFAAQWSLHRREFCIVAYRGSRQSKPRAAAAAAGKSAARSGVSAR